MGNKTAKRTPENFFLELIYYKFMTFLNKAG